MSSSHFHLNRALCRINRSRTSILIVEDDDTTRRLAIELLRAAGFLQLSFARTVEEALEGLRTQMPDLILLSWGLGGEDGLELAKVIRHSKLEPIPNSVKRISQEKALQNKELEKSIGTLRLEFAPIKDPRLQYNHIPIILMSSRRRLYDVHTARNAGITEFIIKPFSSNALLRALASSLTRPRPFIECATYVGPCRRRRSSEFYTGRLRRKEDRQLETIRTAQNAFLQALLADTKNMITLMDKDSVLRPEVYEHLCQRVHMSLERAKTVKLRYVVTALHSLNDFLSYWGLEADLKLIRRHILVISRLCQPHFETQEDCRKMVEDLKQAVAKNIRIGRKRA